MGAMAVNITGVIVVVGKVPTTYVVNVAVIIVVNAVVGNFPWVGPDITHQVRMVVVNPGVNHPDHQVRITGLQIPSFRGVNVCVDGTTILTRVIKAPKLVETGIIGNQLWAKVGRVRLRGPVEPNHAILLNILK